MMIMVLSVRILILIQQIMVKYAQIKLYIYAEMELLLKCHLEHGSINAGTNSISCGSEVIGSTSFINTGVNKLQLFGTDNSVLGPHMQAFTSFDNYPLF